MKNISQIPITEVMGALIIGGLVYFMSIPDNILTTQYNRMNRDLTASEELLDNEANVLEIFPELAVVKQKIMEVRQLHIRKQGFFTHPAPIYSEGEAEVMVRVQEESNGRGGEISIMLDNFCTKMRLVTKSP